jgi:predicted lipoprotein with Yx(FWY)xxD motif
MKHRLLLRSSIALVAIGALAACGSDSDSSATTAPAATTVAPTTAAVATTAAAATTASAGGGGYEIPASAPATTVAAPSSASSLALHTDPTLGPILVDAEGFTVYLFTKDNGTTSVCTDKCAEAWPAAVVTGTPTAGPGLDASKLTASPQPDGTMQLTYNGHLLYRYAPEKAAGDTTGQGVGGVWFVLDASGNQVGDAAAATTTAAAAPATSSLALANDPELGSILVDSEGFTLYLFTKDTGTTSVCTDKCAEAWPAALVTGTPTAGAGIDASKLTASPQPDGTMQLTYNGHLLYRYAPDKAPGDTTGQDVGDVWYVVNAAGDKADG